MNERDHSASESESNRRGFLSKTAALAGVMLGGATVAQAASKSGGTGAMASRSGRGRNPFQLPELYPGSNARQFHQIQSDENAHVQLIAGALGSAARPEPNFIPLEVPDLQSFIQLSYIFENTGVAAYLGVAPVIFDRSILAVAGSIFGIEARHAGYLGVLNHQSMDLFSPVDQPGTIPIIVGNAAPFFQKLPNGQPDLNGGPPLTFDTTPSAQNDVAILNFALALEYLERDFYNINVPKFFGR